MSHRTFKRVPLDFAWPKDKVWEGYINPFYKKSENCWTCKGDSYSPEGRFLHQIWYRHLATDLFGGWYGATVATLPGDDELRKAGASEAVLQNIALARKFRFKTLANWDERLEEEDVLALVKGDRLYDLTSTWTRGEGWKKKEPLVIPTPEEVNAWSRRGLGHDSINQWVCVKARAKKAKVKTGCAACKGSGEHWPDPADKKKAAKWKEHEPPKGPGWQLWETVSEGSPMSPVFATAPELAAWISERGAMGPGSALSTEQVLRLMHDKDGFELSSLMVVAPGKGVQTLAEAQMGAPTSKDWSPKPRE
jgi:hypothetical protein